MLVKSFKNRYSGKRNPFPNKESIKKTKVVHMKWWFLFLLIAITFLSCSSDDNVHESVYVGKTFDFLFFETQQECLDAQTDPSFFINCHQELNFIDTEKARIVLTDIVYKINYSIFNNRIRIHSSANITEFQDDIFFKRISDSSLIRLDNNTIWYERDGESVWD